MSEDDETEPTEPTTEEPMDEIRAYRDRLRQPDLPAPPAGGPATLAAAEAERMAAESKDPTRLAELYAAHRCVGMNEYTLVRWARAWWRYDRSHFKLMDTEDLFADIWKFLDKVDVETVEKNETGGFDKVFKKLVVKRAIVNEVRDALQAVLPRLAGDAPQWRWGRRFEDGEHGLEREPDPIHVVACVNGIFDLKRRNLRPANPRLFITQAIAARWNERASCPSWIEFLDSLWGTDTDTKRALQEMFGYLITNDTAHQKIFGLIGPARSGKGTIMRVLKALLGEVSVANPTLSSLQETFGLEPLIGKSVAIIADARLGGKSDTAIIAERLLSVSGEDALTINCKNTKHVTVRLRTRFVLASNEAPTLMDASGALVSRFVLMRMTESFYGREDHGLESKLTAELDGIFRWAVDGWESLHERGFFVQPAASRDLADDMDRSASPVKAFITDRCTTGAGCEIKIKDLYAAWKDWCSETGRKEPGTEAAFGVKLRAALPTLGTYQGSEPGSLLGTRARPRIYRGICLS